MRVLVTGGAGFIGSHFVQRLVADGHAVTVADNLSTGTRTNLSTEVELIEVDLRGDQGLRALGSRTFEAICHLAGQSSGEKSFDDPIHDFDANARSTLLLAEWATRHGVDRFLHASSMAVYGNPSALPVPENAPIRPISFYGASKHAAEEVLRIFGDSLRTVSLRMFSVYGPGQDLAELRQGMVSIYLSYILKGQPVLVRGPLDRVRDLVFVDDVVDAWARALQTPVTGTINIGTGVGTSVESLLTQLLNACGYDADYPVREQPSTPGDQIAMRADIDKARQDLGWTPTVPVAAGLTTLVRWAQDQVDAWR